jgi:hypothetical protein
MANNMTPTDLTIDSFTANCTHVKGGLTDKCQVGCGFQHSGCLKTTMGDKDTTPSSGTSRSSSSLDMNLFGIVVVMTLCWQHD